MEKEIAVKFVELVKNFNLEFDKFYHLAKEISDKSEGKNIAGAIFDAGCVISEGILKPILKQYPDLDPYDQKIFP